MKKEKEKPKLERSLTATKEKAKDPKVEEGQPTKVARSAHFFRLRDDRRTTQWLAIVGGCLAMVHLIRFIVIMADDFKGWKTKYGSESLLIFWDTYPGLHESSAAFEILAAFFLCFFVLLLMVSIPSLFVVLTALWCLTLMCITLIILIFKLVVLADIDGSSDEFKAQLGMVIAFMIIDILSIGFFGILIIQWRGL